MSTVGERVRAEREARKISRTALSAMTGVGYSTLAELERGGMQTTTKLRVIAEALGVSLSYLETGKGPKAGGPSQDSGLDVEKLTDLLETVEAAIAKSGRVVPPRIKARLVATLYRDEQASAAASAQAVQAALAGLLISME
ncbi:helix-turn-helix domain protein [Pseudoxanthomonas suwonensis 11-1]|uniref:Helix-turn-helix domain protein n=1 Tax=Pseudoxanthomonas suwonensis (strain 11-1) TaxID=743721 RepID=E6WS39_PSEUU|nr:helix-turn-helix transcriptional regulator [Pseudoxanthomonas suwonensis]ADV26988.1 helix-turn-helix domain protein [Pseudoxanthomonas suwonensis 11-1]